jgi:hypothetical protein
MFRRKIHRVLSILVFIATVASPLLAQAPSMTGTVVDQTGAVLPSASVIKPNRTIRSRPCCRLIRVFPCPTGKAPNVTAETQRRRERCVVKGTAEGQNRSDGELQKHKEI